MSYESVLQSLEEGDVVTFNRNASNSSCTPRLTTVVPGVSPMFRDGEEVYQVQHDGGDRLVIVKGDYRSSYPPDQYYDDLETIEIIGRDNDLVSNDKPML